MAGRDRREVRCDGEGRREGGKERKRERARESTEKNIRRTIACFLSEL